jgi:hypothetical protein
MASIVWESEEKQGVSILCFGGNGLRGVEIGAQGGLEHISNDNAISTTRVNTIQLRQNHSF